MSTIVRYSFYVQTQLPAGPSADEGHVDVEFDTDDVDQAHELAERALDNPLVNPLPSNVIHGTLTITSL